MLLSSDVSRGTGWLLEPRLWYIRRGMALFRKPEHLMGKESGLRFPQRSKEDTRLQLDKLHQEVMITFQGTQA